MNKEVLKLALEAYLCREMPAGTVIGNPKWWVPKIANAIKEALEDKFCDNNCVWTDHHPDCKLAQPDRQELQTKGEHPAPCARFCEANAFRIAERGYQRQIRELQAKLAQPEQEHVAWMGDNEIFDKLNHIYGDPKHHKYPLTKGQIVEFGRKLFELGANSSSPKVEQDPVAWTEQQLYDDGTPNPCALLKWAGRKAEDDFPIGTKFYTTPPQRKPLTDEEIERIWESLPFCNGAWETFARAIEVAHGIKE